MPYIGQCLNFLFLPVASNDNDDLLALTSPAYELSLIRELKRSIREENAVSGILLQSPRERKFFQEITDAERYILLRYFTCNVPETLLRQLRRHIMNTYLFPRRRRKSKKPSA